MIHTAQTQVGGPRSFSREPPRWLLLAGVVSVVAGVISTLHWSGLSYLLDDAFITFRYADNLSKGIGLAWNSGGEPTQGSTTLLTVMMLATGRSVGVDPETLMHLLNGLGLIVTAIAIYWVVFTLIQDSWLALLGPLALIGSPIVIANTFSGMATMFWTGLTFAGAASVSTYLSSAKTRYLVAAVVLAMASTLTRPEGFGLGLAWFALLILLEPKRRVRAGIATAAYLVATAAYAFWLSATYGSPWPNSFYIKVADPLLSQRFPGEWYVRSFVYHEAISFASFSLALPFLMRKDRLRSWLPFSVVCLLLPLYVVTAPLAGHHYRFLVPVACFLQGLIIVGPLLLARRLYFASRAPNRWGGLVRGWMSPTIFAALATVALLALAGRNLATNFLHPNRIRPSAQDTIRVGRTLSEVVGIESVRMALGEAGAIPFYSGAQHFDPIGLNDNAIARYGRERGCAWIIDRLFAWKPDLVGIQTFRDGSFGVGAGHGVLGGHFGELYFDPRFKEYIYIGGTDIKNTYRHWWVHPDSPSRIELIAALEPLTDFSHFEFRAASNFTR